MRDIKFRGISKATGLFVYGNLIQTSVYKDGHIHCWIQEKSLLGLGALSTPTKRFTEVHSKTVGQFIDQQDKNGVDIYEGDIVDDGESQSSHCKGGRHLVEYRKGGFSPFSIAGWEGTMDVRNCVVIGNSHQNPELLENKGD